MMEISIVLPLLLLLVHLKCGSSSNQFNQNLFNAVNQQTFYKYTKEWTKFHENWNHLHFLNDNLQKFCQNRDYPQSLSFPVCLNGEELMSSPQSFFGNGTFPDHCPQLQCLPLYTDGECSGLPAATPSDIFDYQPPQPLSSLDNSTICSNSLFKDSYISQLSYGMDEGIPPSFSSISPIRLQIRGRVFGGSSSSFECQGSLTKAKILAWQLDPLTLLPVNIVGVDQLAEDVSQHYHQGSSPSSSSHRQTIDNSDVSSFLLRDHSCSVIQHTTEDGSYFFETLLPPSFGSPRSIFFQISMEGYETLNTRIYFDKDNRLQQLTTLGSEQGLDISLISQYRLNGLKNDGRLHTEKTIFPGIISLDPRVTKVDFVSTDIRPFSQIPPNTLVKGYLRVKQDFVLSPKRHTIHKTNKANKNSLSTLSSSSSVSSTFSTPVIDIDGIWSDETTGGLVLISTYGNFFTAKEIPHARSWNSVNGYLVDNSIKGVSFHQHYDSTSFSQVLSTSLLDTLRVVDSSSKMTGVIVSSDSFNTVAFNHGNQQTPGRYSNKNNLNQISQTILWSVSNKGIDSQDSKIWRKQSNTVGNENEVNANGYRYVKLSINRIMNDHSQSSSLPLSHSGQLNINEIIFYEGYFYEKELPRKDRKMRSPRSPNPQIVTCSSFNNNQENHCFKAFDGDMSSHSAWKTDPIRSKDNKLTSSTQWILLDFGEGQGIKPTGLRIVCDIANANQTISKARGCPMTFSLLVSNDNIRYDILYKADLYDYADLHSLSSSVSSVSASASAIKIDSSVINPFYGPHGKMFYFHSENSNGLNNGEQCGSCLIGPSFTCHINSYDSFCDSRYCNEKGRCSSLPICSKGLYLSLSYYSYHYPSYRCELCPAGRYGNREGLTSSSCSGVCEAGYYCPLGSTSSKQHVCGGSGYYCPEGSSLPFPAPSGKKSIDLTTVSTEDRLNAYRTEDCSLGHYCVNGKEYPCPLGYYGNQTALQTSDCDGHCLPGTYCPVGSILPQACPVGHYCSDGNVYRSCPAGTYGNEEGLATPLCSGYCSPGSFCLDGSIEAKSLPCPAGRYGLIHGLTNANCSGLCHEGFYCPEGSVSPTENECGDSNVYCPEGSSLPIPVSLGYYTIGGSSSLTRTAQQLTEKGFYAFEGFRYPCPLGSYGNSTGLNGNFPVFAEFTVQPTLSPSTISPSRSPTKSPSLTPSVHPSDHPTYLPSQTAAGFVDVSYIHTASPTLTPTTADLFSLRIYQCTGLCSSGYYCPMNSTSATQFPCPAGGYSFFCFSF
jgi:hypothetical protein